MSFASKMFEGVGKLLVKTPHGEVQAAHGDHIVELPGGQYVLDPASHAFLKNLAEKAAVALVDKAVDKALEKKDEKKEEPAATPTSPEPKSN